MHLRAAIARLLLTAAQIHPMLAITRGVPCPRSRKPVYSAMAAAKQSVSPPSIGSKAKKSTFATMRPLASSPYPNIPSLDEIFAAHDAAGAADFVLERDFSPSPERDLF